MLRIENVVLPSAEQLEMIILGMRNPMNSWGKMDSRCAFDESGRTFLLGESDHNLMCKLAKGGSVHAKYRRMMVVYVTMTAHTSKWKERATVHGGARSD